MGKWAIGDIHGCYNTLRELIEKKLCPSTDDTLIFLGDYIDRGPSSRQVIDYICYLEQLGIQTICLQGNHEELLLKNYEWEKKPPKSLFLKKQNPFAHTWYAAGANETLASFGVQRVTDIPEKYIQWLNQTRLFVEEDKFLLVHAGFNFNYNNIFDDTASMKWIRQFEPDLKKTGGKRIIHGHVPVPLEVIRHCIETPELGFIDIDNGCVYKGREGMGNLIAINLETLEIKVQANIEKLA
ncbi:MAG: serine/threonine protein phosphatase [Flavobacteriales bacterium]|nr:serine/threonine protein phosphatase [Flavobacteriales bacterium]